MKDSYEIKSLEDSNSIQKNKKENNLNKSYLKSNLNQKRQDHEIKLKKKIKYKINEKPPVHLSFFLGLQIVITVIASYVSYSIVISNAICLKDNDENKILIMQSILLTSGLATLLQTLLGIRLPLIQGPSISFMIPILALAEMPNYQCPSKEKLALMNETDYHNLWSSNLNSIQGSLILVGLVQFVAGSLGAIQYIISYVTPVCIGPTILVLGMTLSKISMKESAKNFSFYFLTICFIILFTQYLERIYILIPRLKKKENSNSKKKFFKIRIFRLFPIILTVACVWIIAAIFTYYNLIPKGDEARVDGDKLKLLYESNFINIPLPFQFGMPKISLQLCLSFFCATLVCTFESFGNYYAISKLTESSNPTKESINRGIAIEGLSIAIAGLFGSSGLTSYSENIGVIAITKVASREVIYYTSFILIFLSFFSKISSFLAICPSPIVGGVIGIVSAIIISIGISIIQYINLEATRNLFIVGISIVCGFFFPLQFQSKPGLIKTGYESFDHLLIVLLTNSIFITLFISFILDNTIKCKNPDDRGLNKWLGSTDTDLEKNIEIYDLPGSLSKINGDKLNKFLPIFPKKKLNNKTINPVNV